MGAQTLEELKSTGERNMESQDFRGVEREFLALGLTSDWKDDCEKVLEQCFCISNSLDVLWTDDPK